MRPISFFAIAACSTVIALTSSAFAQAPALAPRLKYQDGMPPPPGYHLEENPRKGFVISGAVTLGTTWFLSATIGAASTNSADRWLFLPVVGPFADLAARGNNGCSSTNTNLDCALDPVLRFYLAFDGVAQTAGGALLLVGFLVPKREYVSDTYYGTTLRGPRIASWTIAPRVTRDAPLGLTFAGEIF